MLTPMIYLSQDKGKGMIKMAKKPSLTPREKVVMNKIGVDDNYATLNKELENLAQAVSEIQEIAYFEAIGIKVPKETVKAVKKTMDNSYKEVNRLYSSATGEQITRTYVVKTIN